VASESALLQGERKNLVTFIKHIYKLTTWGCSIQDTDKMCEEGFPNAQFKFVHEIDDKTRMDIEIPS